MRAANLAVRFLLELCALAALAVWGWQTGGPLAARLVLAVAAPLAAAVAWGRWVAPRARNRLPDPARLGVEVVVFAAASLGLLAAGHPAWALGLAAVYAVNVTLGFVFDQRAL